MGYVSGYSGMSDFDRETIIPISGTDSAAVDCGGQVLAGIILPAAFTGTALTFKVAGTLGGTYTPLYDSSGSLVSMTVAQGRAYAVDPKNFSGVRFLKVVSGTTEIAARTLILSLRG